MAIAITYDVEGSRYASSTQVDTWTRRWVATGIVATTVPDAIVEILGALPSIGATAPLPVSQLLKVVDRDINQILAITNAQGAPTGAAEALGTVVYSTTTNVITSEPPVNDTGPGITLSGRGYVQQRLVDTARPEGTNDLEQCTVQWSNGKEIATPIEAPEFGESIQFTRNEITNPRARLSALRGTVNASAWNGYAQDSVLLSDATYETINGGLYYTVTYEFVRLPSGWAIPITGRDLEAGQRPIRSPTSAQRKLYIPYARGDFSVLGIVL